MKRTYCFLYKTLAALLLIALVMCLAYGLLGLAYGYAKPDAPDLPSAFRNEQDLVLMGLALCSIGILACLAYLLRGAGRRPGEEGFVPGWQEKIPLDVYLCALLVCFFLLLSVLTEISYGNSIDFTALLLFCLPVAAGMALLVLALLTTLSARLKLGGWWKNTACYWLLCLALRCLRWAGRLIKRLWASLGNLLAGLPTIWPVGLGVGAFLLTAFILATDMLYGMGILIWFALCAAGFILCCQGALQFGALEKITAKIADGDLEAKVNTSRMLPVFRRQGESINRIGAGLNRAVEARLKSERFKTELITNVSHDLKTPLTSIINYVDLLAKEPLHNPKAEEYIEVLYRQAQRLKKLTEDLVEASKASTGNINVERSAMDVAELLSQCSAEYTERMTAAGLSMICDVPKGLVVQADGRLLWRVFDNLLGNACKYAQPGTRVYLTARAEGGRAILEIKNISREVLNISAEELMERFVRGDSSRSQEGSGLGLSIAQSLMELNGGKLTLHVDGDLFKARLDLELAS